LTQVRTSQRVPLGPKSKFPASSRKRCVESIPASQRPHAPPQPSPPDAHPLKPNPCPQVGAAPRAALAPYLLPLLPLSLTLTLPLIVSPLSSCPPALACSPPLSRPCQPVNLPAGQLTLPLPCQLANWSTGQPVSLSRPPALASSSPRLSFP